MSPPGVVLSTRDSALIFAPAVSGRRLGPAEALPPYMKLFERLEFHNYLLHILGLFYRDPEQTAVVHWAYLSSN